MKRAHLNDMTRGWLVGDFEPSLYRTSDVEVAVQRRGRGERDPRHCHRIATEIVVVVSGRAVLNGEVFGPGDIAVAEPGEPMDLLALEDGTATVCVKIPGPRGDKYLLEDEAIPNDAGG